MVDSSHTPTFEAFVLNDQNAITSTPLRAGRYDYMRQNADLNGRYQLNRYAALTVGVGWEGWDRNSNWEVGHTDEAIAKVALDVTPTDWLLIRATYQPSFRRGDGYNTNAFLKENGNVPPGFAGSASQDYQLRKFNEADRDRQKADLMVQITPIDQLSITPSVGYKFDNYVASGMQHDGNTVNLQQLGLQQAVSWSAGHRPQLDAVGPVLLRHRLRARVHLPEAAPNRSATPSTPRSTGSRTAPTRWRRSTPPSRPPSFPDKADLLINGSFSYALGRVAAVQPERHRQHRVQRQSPQLPRRAVAGVRGHLRAARGRFAVPPHAEPDRQALLRLRDRSRRATGRPTP